MMVAETATAPLIPVPCSDEEQHVESTTACAYCANAVNVYAMAAEKWICEDHLKRAVTMAACDIWPGSVKYDKAFEDSLW